MPVSTTANWSKKHVVSIYILGIRLKLIVGVAYFVDF